MYLISYDIASDRMRSKVAKKLLNYGKRVQYSVFECHIDIRMYQKLYSELIEIIVDEKQASIRFYYMDKLAQTKITTIGTPSFFSKGEDEDVIFI